MLEYIYQNSILRFILQSFFKEKHIISHIEDTHTKIDLKHIDTIYIKKNDCRFGNTVIAITHCIFLAKIYKFKIVFEEKFLLINISEFDFRKEKQKKERREIYVNLSTLFANRQRGTNSLFHKKKYTYIQKYINPNFNFKKIDSYDFSKMLVIHIRSGDIFNKIKPHPRYAQPPFHFYKKIIDDFGFKNILIVTEPDMKNPCIELIKKEYPHTIIQSSTLENDIHTLLNAQYLIVGNGTFSSVLSMISKNIKIVFTTDKMKRFYPKTNFKIFSYSLPSYDMHWQNTPEQIDKMKIFNTIVRDFNHEKISNFIKNIQKKHTNIYKKTKLYISENNNEIFSNKINKIEAFSEYGLKYKEIPVNLLTDQVVSNTKEDSILLIPVTNLLNVWHIVHHLFLTYKYQTTNNIKTKNIYFIFFKESNFYERTKKNILTRKYLELFFKGLGFDYHMFLKTYDTFKDLKAVEYNKVYIVNENINFNHEPLFRSFTNHIIKNYNISNDKFKNKIVFILRRKTRQILNIEYCKTKLSNYSIKYVYMEDLSIKEQLELVSNCEILIGMHGQGLTWSIFMKPNSKLIEMYPGNSKNDNYIRFCKLTRVKYHRIPTNIVYGTEQNFREATVELSDSQIENIKNIIG